MMRKNMITFERKVLCNTYGLRFNKKKQIYSKDEKREITKNVQQIVC